MFQRVRGRAVIINNEYFVKGDTRFGCQNDIADLQKLFDKLHFEIRLHENKPAQVCFFSLPCGVPRSCYARPIGYLLCGREVFLVSVVRLP